MWLENGEQLLVSNVIVLLFCFNSVQAKYVIITYTPRQAVATKLLSLWPNTQGKIN